MSNIAECRDSVRQRHSSEIHRHMHIRYCFFFFCRPTTNSIAIHPTLVFGLTKFDRTFKCIQPCMGRGGERGAKRKIIYVLFSNTWVARKQSRREKKNIRSCNICSSVITNYRTSFNGNRGRTRKKPLRPLQVQTVLGSNFFVDAFYCICLPVW